MVREVVCIHIGQAGIQIANAAWEIFCLEHGVKADGTVSEENIDDEEDVARQTFFEPSSTGLNVPRSIFIDTEPTVVDEIRCGPYKSLYHPSRLINAEEDAANNFARGYHYLGKILIEDIMRQIRITAESGDSLQGFFITNGYGGGTGSGLCCLMLQKMTESFGKHSRVVVSVYPSMSLSTSVVEPYNCVLNRHIAEPCADVELLMDNEALYDICGEKLDLQFPTYLNLNRVIAQLISSITLTFRYSGTINTDMGQIQTNLIPYPRLHYPIIRYSPLFSYRRIAHTPMNSNYITKEVFCKLNQTIKCDTTRGLFMAVLLSYRGKVNVRDVSNVVQNIRENAVDVRFVDWCPTGFKIGMCDRVPVLSENSDMVTSPIAVTMMGNTSAIGQTFTQLKSKYDLLMRKRAFLQWYLGEGLEVEEMTQAGASLEEIRGDYLLAANPTAV